MSSPALQPKPEIPQLTDAYRKAHKAYVLASGLLASWELIGITLDTKGRWGVELKSPNAVPLILLTLVFYSGYKTTIEWLQCDRERRKNRPAKWDYLVSHLVAIIAIGIGVIQWLARIQIVDWLREFAQLKENQKKLELQAYQRVWPAGAFLLFTVALLIIVKSVQSYRQGKLKALRQRIGAFLKR